MFFSEVCFILILFEFAVVFEVGYLWPLPVFNHYFGMCDVIDWLTGTMMSWPPVGGVVSGHAYSKHDAINYR